MRQLRCAGLWSARRNSFILGFLLNFYRYRCIHRFVVITKKKNVTHEKRLECTWTKLVGCECVDVCVERIIKCFCNSIVGGVPVGTCAGVAWTTVLIIRSWKTIFATVFAAGFCFVLSDRALWLLEAFNRKSRVQIKCSAIIKILILSSRHSHLSRK